MHFLGMWFENLKINLKIFLKYGGINRFTRKSTSILERYKVLTSCKMYPWSKFWRTRVAISMFVYHFWSWPGGYNIFKNRTAENGGRDFEIEGSDTSAYLLRWGPEKISCRYCLLFHSFFGKKKRYWLSSLDYWILLICQTMARKQEKETHYGHYWSV